MIRWYELSIMNITYIIVAVGVGAAYGCDWALSQITY